MMKQKYLVTPVSIAIVVFLILGSLTNVIGYQSVKPKNISDSPLFITRTQKATNKQQHIITSMYLGMGKVNPFQIPTKDKRIEQLKKIIEFISKMDVKTFEQFTELCIQKARQAQTLGDTHPYEIIQALHFLKTKPETIISSLMNTENLYIITTNPWIPGCIIFYIVLFLFLNLLRYFTDYTLDCDPTYRYDNRDCLMVGINPIL